MIDSVKKAFVLSVKALKLFYILAAVNIVANIINLLVIPAPAPVTIEMTLGSSFTVIGLTILLVLISVFVLGGALTYIKELIKTGSANLSSFMDNGKKYFLRLLPIAFVLSSIPALSIFLIVVPPPTLIFIIVQIILISLFILLFVSIYALVGNDLSIIGSVKKSVLVVRKNLVKILVIGIIMFLVFIAVMIVASLVSGILSVILRPIGRPITALVIAIANAVLTVLVSIAYMDFYLKSSEQSA